MPDDFPTLHGYSESCGSRPGLFCPLSRTSPIRTPQLGRMLPDTERLDSQHLALFAEPGVTPPPPATPIETPVAAHVVDGVREPATLADRLEDIAAMRQTIKHGTGRRPDAAASTGLADEAADERFCCLLA